MSCMRRVTLAGIVVAVSAVIVPSAAADGLPVLGVDVGSSGVATPDGIARYVTIPATGGTLVERIRQDGGQVLATSLFPGTFTIPAVAYDASAGGLSGDRRTLVLIEPRTSFPRATTKLLVLRTPALRYRTTVTLHGDFSFDAVSPGGRRLYLIQYVSTQDPTRYAVRSYDLSSMELDPKPVIDPLKADEKMRGQPLSRAASADGRWAYTLYDGAGGTPFVHALDTARGTARCIDLDELDRTALWRLSLRMTDGGRSVSVVNGTNEVLSVDTATLRVDSGHARAWWPIVTLAALVAAVFVLAAALVRRRPDPLVPGLAP